MRARLRTLTALSGVALVLGGVSACSEEDQQQVEEQVDKGAAEVEQQVEEGAEEPSEASPS